MMPDDRYIVICRLGKDERQDEPAYTLATRQTFATWAHARRYARTVARSRRPIVVGGRFHQLRTPAHQEPAGADVAPVTEHCKHCGLPYPYALPRRDCPHCGRAR